MIPEPRRFYHALITVPMDERAEAEDALACEGVEYRADPAGGRTVCISITGGAKAKARAVDALTRRGFFGLEAAAAAVSYPARCAGCDQDVPVPMEEARARIRQTGNPMVTLREASYLLGQEGWRCPCCRGHDG